MKESHLYYINCKICYSLFFEPEPDVSAEALYQRNEQGSYDYIPEEERYDIFDRNEKVFEKDDYIENLGIK